MGNTVYAEGMGFFHKGSGGKGVAPGDVCLSPPPPPTGPVPVPYVNMLQASNLAKGSKTVKIQGNPTALENVSNISTSSGDEAGTQGGGVVTHKTKGKGSFKLWSFTVKVEGKGVCRHGDPMGQNHMSDPPNSIDNQAIVNFKAYLVSEGIDTDKECDPHYSQDCRPNRTAEQRDAVNGNPCWQCGNTDWRVGWEDLERSRNAAGDMTWQNYMTHDHQPPLQLAWEMGGCHLGQDAFKEHFGKAKVGDHEVVKPHCKSCYLKQSHEVKKYVANMFGG